MATERINYVDPDVVGGAGDGSSWANAYVGLSEWEAAENGNLTSGGGTWEHCYCRSGSGTDDLGKCSINGWTTDANCYIKIEAASGHRASASAWSATKYIIDGDTDHAFEVYDNNVWLDGLQMDTGAGQYHIEVANVAASSWCRISNCRFNGAYHAVYVSDADSSTYVWNSIMDSDSRLALLITGTMYLYNCVCYGSAADGIEADAGTIVVKNCAVFNCADDFDIAGGVTATIDYCASDDNDGTNNVVESGGGASWTSDFIDAANGDFRIKAGSNLIGAGVVDPGSGLFSDDIEGTARGAAWDVGAFEYVAAAGTTYIPQMMAYYMRLRNN